MTFRNILIILVTALISGNISLRAQDEYPLGRVTGKLYIDYRQQLNGEGSYHGFSNTRSFLGYEYKADSKLSAMILLDIGDPLSTGDVSSKRYFYIRNAYITYTNNKLNIRAGITDGTGHKVQLAGWGKRYIMRSFLLQYRFLNVADIGMVASYNISPVITLDAEIFNGEGYTNIQADNSLLYGAGLTIRPANEIVVRLFADTYSHEGINSQTISSFVRYSNDKFSVAAEYDYKSDFDLSDGHNAYGYSVMGDYNAGLRINLFMRLDRLMSTKTGAEDLPWNIARDGQMIITGVEYKYSQNLRFSLSYQGWKPADDTMTHSDFLQANLEFKF